MKKRIITLVLAITMVLQTMVPLTSFAKDTTPEKNSLVKVGTIDVKSYPQLDAKTVQEANRRKKRELQGRRMERGAQLFRSPYFPNQDPTAEQKPLIFANVNAIFTTRGLDGGNFDWEGVFGKDVDGKLNKAQIVFEQMDDKTSTRTGVKFFLKVDKAGTYTWSDSEGKPTKLPLYSTNLKPYRYEVLLDEDVTEHVKLLTARFFGTEGGHSFGKADPNTGEIVGNINLDLSLQQIASTKFTSKWNTGVVEAERPRVEGSYLTGYEATQEDYGIFKFPSNDTDKTIIRNDAPDQQNPGEYSEYRASDLDKTPTVGVADPDPDATDTYTLDRNKKKISYKGKTYKYDLTYDVIKGGKITMTEVIPVTFDANGGKFASITKPDAEQKIVKEVDYDGTLTDKAENPTKDRETFKGWSTTKDGKTPVTDAEFANIKEAKTFYAIWDNNDIVADQLEVKESFKDGDTWVNSFIPTLDKLKGQVKIKDASVTSQALADTDKFAIVDGDREYTTDEDLKTYLYDKLKEKDNPNDEPTRVETVKAKVTHANGTSQTVDIPIKVIKNIYEAKTLTEKPFYVPKDYVKVTVDPTTKAKDPQKYFYYVNKNAKVVIPGKDPTGVGDNKFVKWTIKEDTATGDGTEYKLNDKPRTQFEKASTITAQYVSDVIPQTGEDKPNTVPANFVKVRFVPTDKATDETKAEKIYWVNPEKEVTIPVKDPVGKQYFTFIGWKMGAKADGAEYNPNTPKKFTDTNGTIITATYEEATNIIPFDPTDHDDSSIVRPNGYVKITFKAEKGLELTEEKAYYVKKNAGVKLSDIKNDTTDYGYPGYTVETGYKFDKWDKEDKFVITDADIVVTAKATKLDNVIPEKDDKGNTNEKPVGYKEVKFVVKTGDEAKGSITGVAKFYVNPTEYVKINPPATNENTGYKFGAWDTDATIPTVYDKNTTITGSFNDLKAVIPKTKNDDSEKPKGYVTVTFEIEKLAGKEAGKIVGGETITYFVKPNIGVTIPQPKTVADTGYEFKEWDQDTTTTKKYKADTTVKGNFKKLDDIIPATDGKGTPNAKPEGYVAVTFDKGANGKSIEGQTVYYVNPTANITLGDTKIAKPTVTPETGYKADGWDKKDSQHITGDLTVTAKYKELYDVIPKTKDNESEKPEGYITVTFSTEKDGKIKGTKDTTKVLYVNPNKAAVLTPYAPEVTPNTGFDFAGWDTQIERAIKYNNNDVIKAKYNVKGDVIPQEKTDGSDKPAGYLTVTFVKGDHGELNGKTVYYVKPNKEVTVPAPDVKPSVGYEFEKWDKELTQTFTADTTIKAGYKALDNIIPQGKTDSSDKPNGYVTVTFKADANGTLSGTTVYYVKPNVDIDLTDTAKDISKNPNTGYTAEGGTWSPAIENKQYTADAEYKFNFKALQDVIEKIDENTKKPEGYITVKLIPTYKATDKTEKVYFVNPLKEVTIKNKPEGKEMDINGNKSSFKFIGWTVTRGAIASWTDENIKGKFIQETDITAKYEFNWINILQEPIAKENAVTAKGDVPEAKDLIKNIPGSPDKPLPVGTNITYEKTPDVDNKGNVTAKVKVEYPGGAVTIVDVPLTVVDNVVPQIGNDKPLVPETYVKVTVDTTNTATDNTKFVNVFWVKPNKKVKIPDILAPTGKKVVENGVTKTNNFKKWKLVGSNPEKFYETEIEDTFTAKESTIVATYEQDKNVEPKGKNNQWIPQGSNPSPKDFIENPYNDDDPNNKDNLPPGTKIEFVKGKEPDTKTPGTDKKTTIKITYPNGETKEVPVKYNVTGDVVEQKEGEDKPNVPDNYVKVILIPTDKATDGKNKVYFVNPKAKNVTITKKPEGKKEKVNNIDQTYTFKGWKVTKGTVASWANENINGQFTQDTEITAQYSTNVVPEKLVPAPVAKKNIVTPKGDKPEPGDLIKNIPGSEKDPLPKGTKITYEKEPKVDKPGDSTAKVKIEYPNGKTVVIEVPITVVDNVVPQIGNEKPLVPENYVKVIVDTTDKAEENTRFVKTFWVKPNVEVTIPGILAPTGKTETINGVKKKNKFVKWQLEGNTTKTYGKEIKDKFTANVSKIIATYEFGKDETTPDQPGDKPGEVEKHGHRYIERVAGKDRVHTAINTSRRFFNKSRYVIIADSGNYPDALTATVLAHVLDAPILLNNTRYLEDDVAREIVRLGASEVIIVGGHKSISENVKSQLARYDQNSVQRIWGRDRYVTSSELAYEIQRLTGKVNKAIIASGENFPDALATAPLGSKEIAPILLVRRNQIDKKVDKALKDLNIKRVYVAGGQHSVSKKLEEQLPQVIRRFNGRDRYETAVLVASYTYPESKEVFVASGEVFPDALVIGPVCARRKAPILLSRTTPVKVTDDYIEKSKIEYLYIIGGTNTIYAETAHKYAIED
ncbi:repeat protein [Peptostreptococcus anaerobius 653-L]|uniref:Repeat protein n=1 Tax=Peptostreptococcus anaerobius 653-L TaxID=596329 RepID=D3MS20_9FIRM|nr:cell wall-binding repeat-containing protein [Peptostreptococcus anaerobius]EFD05136.1 repeat protein [Peptostreptococcus anaerobius 653-L]